jgi:hypothetical protein
MPAPKPRRKRPSPSSGVPLSPREPQIIARPSGRAEAERAVKRVMLRKSLETEDRLGARRSLGPGSVSFTRSGSPQRSGTRGSKPLPKVSKGRSKARIGRAGPG